MNSSFSQKQSFNVSNHDRGNVLKFKRDIPVRHLPTIRDDVTVVWLEDSQFSSLIENNTQLQTFTWIDRCSILFYSNMTRCVKYLKRVRSREYVIIVIISYPIEATHKMIYRLRQYRIVQTIYIVSSKGNTIDYFSSNIGNIVIFQDKNSMLNRLELLIHDIQEEKFEGGLFTTFDSNAKALKNIREEPASFIWFHVFKGQQFVLCIYEPSIFNIYSLNYKYVMRLTCSKTRNAHRMPCLLSKRSYSTISDR
jgi:hypothetical protein